MPDGAPARAPLGPGCLILVVGPSGAGKDSLIDYARRHFRGDDRVHFPRRVVTRRADASEDHESVSKDEFSAMLAADRFALHWEAHGLAYGVPAEIDGFVAAGNVVVVNVSRSIMPVARCRYAAVEAVHIVAPVAVLAERLRSRNREAPGDALGRLARSDVPADLGPVLEIMNDGPIAAAGDRLVALISDRLTRLRSAV